MGNSAKVFALGAMFVVGLSAHAVTVQLTNVSGVHFEQGLGEELLVRFDSASAGNFVGKLCAGEKTEDVKSSILKSFTQNIPLDITMRIENNTICLEFAEEARRRP